MSFPLHALSRWHPSPKPNRVFINSTVSCCVLHVWKGKSIWCPDLILQPLSTVHMKKHHRNHFTGRERTWVSMWDGKALARYSLLYVHTEQALVLMFLSRTALSLLLWSSHWRQASGACGNIQQCQADGFAIEVFPWRQGVAFMSFCVSGRVNLYLCVHQRAVWRVGWPSEPAASATLTRKSKGKINQWMNGIQLFQF